VDQTIQAFHDRSKKTASTSVYTPPAAEQAQQSYSASTTTASTDLNYIKTLGGGNAMKSGPNYSGVSRSFQKTASTSVYTPPAAEQAQQSYSASTTSASTDLNYMKTLGGGSAMKSGPNYSGVSRSFQKTASTSVYTPPAVEQAQQSYSASTTTASTDLNYMKTLGGGSAMKSGPNYSGVSRSFQKTASTSVYTPPVSQPAQQSYSVDASVPASTDLNYIKTLGGGSAMKSGPNYSGVSRSFQKTASTSVYTPPASQPAQQSYSVDASVPASTDLNYMKTLGGGSAMKSGPNYSGVSRSFQKTASTSVYTPPASQPAQQSYSFDASVPASTDLNYIKSIGGGNAMKSGPNYMGVSRSFQQATASNVYTPPAAAPVDQSYSAASSFQSNNDLNYIKTLGGGSSMKSGPNYSGVSRAFNAPTQGSLYSAPITQSYSSEQTSYSSDNGVSSNNDLQYIKSLGGGNAMKSGNNYSGVSSTFRPTGSGSQYMEALKEKAMAPASYSSSSSYSYNSYVEEANAAPVPAPVNGSYLDSNGPVSSSYGSMNNSFAKATKNYMGVNPRPRATQSAFGSYVERL